MSDRLDVARFAYGDEAGETGRSPLSFFGWAILAVCAVAQLYLVLTKSFNWDEFLHFSQVYQLRAGTLSQPFQVLHSRILWWAPYTSDNLIDQMRAARLFVWACHLVTLGLIYGIARRFVDRQGAVLAAAAYWTAGYVFTHGFSIRADPLVAMTLMAGLFVLSRPRLSLWGVIAVGVAVGIAGMMTFKAAFYAPAFLGLLWLNRHSSEGRANVIRHGFIIAIAAAATFGAIYFYHTAGLASSEPPLPGKSHVQLFMRWIVVDLPFFGYVIQEAMLAPVFILCALAAPFLWRRGELDRDRRIALWGFLLPLVTIFFYRNTFPYYFTFLLAPVAVASSPVLAALGRRFSPAKLVIVMAAGALVMAIKEPRDVMPRQAAMIGYVHREYPHPVGYLDYSQMVADYPRVLKYLTSGNGLRAYDERGDSIIAREFERGNLPFIIANYPLLIDALGPQTARQSFLPADLKVLRGNYVHQWNGLWREGKTIPRGASSSILNVDRDNRFIVDGGPVTIDDRTYRRGDLVDLQRGPHRVNGAQFDVILWSGDRLPGRPPNIDDGPLFTQF